MVGTGTINYLTHILHSIFGTNIHLEYNEKCLKSYFQIVMTKMEEYQANKAKNLFRYQDDSIDSFEVFPESDANTYKVVIFTSNIDDFIEYINNLNERYGLDSCHPTTVKIGPVDELQGELHFTMTDNAWDDMMNKICKWNLVDPDYRKVFNNSILNNGFHIDKIYADKKKKTVAVKWKDGTVTKAKTTEDFDLETGVAMAVLKKVIISHHHLQKIIEKKTIFTDEVKKEK